MCLAFDKEDEKKGLIETNFEGKKHKVSLKYWVLKAV